jgi:hypothetical protein
MATAPKDAPASNLLENTISQSAYWQVNKAIAKALGSIEAAALLADLIAKRRYFRERGQLDSAGGFFNVAEYIEDSLVLTKERRQKWTKLLVKKGLIRVVKRGMPSRNYYYINDDAVTALLSQSAGNPAHLSAENPADKSVGKPATNKNREKKKKQEPVPAPVSTLGTPAEPPVNQDSRSWLKTLEQLSNCPGVPRKTREMLQSWAMREKRFGNGPTPGKLKTVEKIKAELTGQQRRDLQDDDDMDEIDAQDELTALMIQLRSADPSMLKSAYQTRYGERRLGLLTRKWSFEDVVEFQRQTRPVQEALNSASRLV